jgi:putative polyhydroxyalkanoate system protein
MAEILIDRAHTIGLDRAREVALRIAAELTDQYDMDCCWEGDLLSFSRVGAHGTLEIDPDRIRVVLKLGILLSAFKPMIEDRLHRNFDRYFA